MSNAGPFSSVEHPIPESLGNDDLFLSVGFVCDRCNQYFGSKVEAMVICSPLFSFERMAFAIPSKKKKVPVLDGGDFCLSSTGSTDRLVFAGPEDVLGQGHMIIVPDLSELHTARTVRFFLKMGLELLLASDEVDPFNAEFDSARRCARFGDGATAWELAYGLYPHRDQLLISRSTDALGDLETHQIYEYSIGSMPNGDKILSFIFTNHVFACNLTSPSLSEYLNGFNSANEFRLEVLKPIASTRVYRAQPASAQGFPSTRVACSILTRNGAIHRLNVL